LSLHASPFSLVFSRAMATVIVHVYGPLDARTAPELKHRLVDVIDGQGNRRMVLDLRKTTRVDAVGFAVMVDALRRQTRRGGDLVVSGPTPEVLQAFAAAGLDKVFSITRAWEHPVHGGAGATVRPLPRSG
jgi:anti-anti-sigma factor